MRYIIITLLLPVLVISWAYGQQYTDVTSQLGIDHFYGEDVFGAGVSFHDFDQDGWDDLSFTTEEGDSLVFYKNMGGTFQRIYFQGVHHTGNAKQILWCDYDNDGDKDLLVTSRGFGNYLYVNFGNFLMLPYQLPSPNGLPSAPTYAAAFGDYDGDGFLDIFICNRAIGLNAPNQLFRNNGDGTLTDMTENYFFQDSLALTFAAAFVDINNDLLPDIYTAEDRRFINQIYKNAGNGDYVDDCNDCGAEIMINAMSVCPGDYDNDGDLDIYVSNTAQGNALLRNEGDESFTDVAIDAAVTYNRVAWGATFFDFDHDKDLDLYVSGSTNGETHDNELYDNQGDGTFVVPDAGFIGDSTRSFGHAVGDINNDGYYDIAVLNIDTDSSQLWQSSGGLNNWIKIKLEGTVSNREGIGTWIEVWCGGEKQVRYTTCGEGYLAQNPDYQIIGLGSTSTADSIIIIWQSGITDRLENIQANQKITVLEGSTITSNNEISGPALRLYPQPASESVYLELPESDLINASYRILDLSGRLIRSGKIFLNRGPVEIPVSDLHEGAYILQLFGKNLRQSMQFEKFN